MARFVPSVVILLLLALLSGCVGSDAPPAEPTGDLPLEPEAGMDDGDGEATMSDDDVPMFLPVETAFVVEGEAPGGVWVCALAQTPWPNGCNVAVTDQGAFVQTVAHTMPVAGIRFTFSFTPVTPNVHEMNLMVHAGPGEEPGPIYHEIHGDGDVIDLTGLHLNATDTIVLMAWPTPDADAAGPVSFKPLAQPWTADGVLVEMREA